MAAQSGTIRSLERGVTVLRFIGQRAASSLADIHKGTGLPKPTLLRILNTLEETGMIWRGMGDGFYRISTDPADVLPREQLIAERRADERVQKILEELTLSTGWPSDYAVCDGYWMVPRRTTRAMSKKFAFRDVLRRRIAIMPSALGRAYLGFCPPRECNRILQNLRGRGDPENSTVYRDETVRAIIGDVRRLGYGVREPGYGDLSAAIAVPIADGDTVLACANLVWRPGEISLDEFVAKHLDDLRRTADRIGALLLNSED